MAPLPRVIIAADSRTGPIAVLGGGGSCFKVPLPIASAATAVVVATSGSGIAAAQVFVK